MVSRLTDEQRRLVEDNMDLVRPIALRTLPKVRDVEDKISCGNRGLVRAALRFDPERGVKFRQYAARRVGGEILDAYRSGWNKLIHMPRYAHQVVGWDEVNRLRATASGSIPTGDGRSTLMDARPSPDEDPLPGVDVEKIWLALRTLGVKTSVIFALHVGYGWPLRRIADRIGFSESRVSQILARTPEDLRGRPGFREAVIL